MKNIVFFLLLLTVVAYGMWVGEKRPGRANLNEYDHDARSDRRLAIAEDISVTTAAVNADIFKVPGYAKNGIIVTKIILRCVSFTVGTKSVQAVISFGGPAAYNDVIGNNTFTVTGVGRVGIIWDTTTRVVAADEIIDWRIVTASGADVETWDIEIWGYEI